MTQISKINSLVLTVYATDANMCINVKGNVTGGLTMAERKPDAMDCWHFIAPLIPLSDDFSMTVYVKTFHAFQLLEAEEKMGEEQKDYNGE